MFHLTRINATGTVIFHFNFAVKQDQVYMGDLHTPHTTYLVHMLLNADIHTYMNLFLNRLACYHHACMHIRHARTHALEHIDRHD